VTSRLRALVIGGSVGGLFAAHLLRSIGWDVKVFERSAGDLASRGTGIAATDALFAVMQRVGVPLDASVGIPVRSRLSLDRGGNVVAEVPAGGRTTAWARVYRALKDALPAQCYHFNLPVKRVDQGADGVTAEFADGTRTGGDLVIAADGLESTVRRQFLPSVAPRYAGYVAWRGVVEGRDTPPEIQERFFDRIIFCCLDGELLLAMPNPGTGDDIHSQGRRYYFVWYRPVDFEEALPRLCTDSSGRQHGLTIPPPLIRPEVIRDLKANAESLLPPQVAAVVHRTEQPLLQAIFDCESPRVVFGRVALLGDAAFVARPHVAAGVTKAALDAHSLVGALAASPGDLDRALMQYDHEQRHFGGRLVARARLLGAHLEGHRNSADQGDGTTRTWTPENYMREYGADELIAERHRQLTNRPGIHRDA
jgi:2-polyprenyl-6-methoxyphenol hydroxylase-like FAD-dependent oxidoreductase